MPADNNPADSSAGGKKSKRPEDSAFKQQKLPAWQPVLTASSVLPTFFIVGFAFLPISIGLFFSSQSVQEFQLEYTNCTNVNGGDCGDFLESEKAKAFANENATALELRCECEKTFKLEENFTTNVFLYYKLTNFYQNHRRYVKSRDDNQLAGKLSPSEMPSDDCNPFRDLNSTPIAPCGAVANSLFNDTLDLYRCENGDCSKAVPVLRTNIAWPTDKSTKFQNPEGKPLKDAFNGSVKPPFWSKNVWELDTEDETNNGFQNEDFIVWMRTAALPNFRKLYRRVDHGKPGYEGGLPAGEYKLKIGYNYPVISFEGTKTLIIANTSWMGGKNNFLAIAYFVVSIVCILLGVVFLIIHIKMPAPSSNQNGGGAGNSEVENRH